MRKLVWIFIGIAIISISFLSIADAKKFKVVNESSGVMFGVREYWGILPPEIHYESLGEIEAKGRGGMVVEMMHNAKMALLAKAKNMGANAVIKVDYDSNGVIHGEAIIAETFPDLYSEEDFEKFKGPKTYSNSEIFKYKYNAVFMAIIKILENELYAIDRKDLDEGVIETKPIEVPTGKFAWTGADLGGPYPVMKLVIEIKRLSESETQVTENYVFVKGATWDKSMLKKNNKTFFTDIKKQLKKGE